MTQICPVCQKLCARRITVRLGWLKLKEFRFYHQREVCTMRTTLKHETVWQARETYRGAMYEVNAA
jgi:hypothetical protein